MEAVAIFWNEHQDLLWDSVLAGSFIVLAWFLGRLARWILAAYSQRRGESPAARFIATLGNPAFRLILLLGLSAANRVVQPYFSPNLRIYPPALFSAGIFLGAVLTIVLFLRQLFRQLIQYYVEHAEGEERNLVTRDFAPLLQRVFMVVVYLSTAAFVLHRFQYDISSIVVSLGIGTVAIGLAAQDTLSNMIAGFLIMFDRPFRIGDRIELESKTVGDVVDIGLRTTRIKTLNNTVVIVPNAYLTRNPVTNHTYPNRRSRVELPFTVVFETDPAPIPGLFAECAGQVAGLLADPAPECLFTGMGAAGLQFLGTAWVADYAEKARATHELGARLVDRLHQAGLGLARPDGTCAPPPRPRP